MKIYNWIVFEWDEQRHRYIETCSDSYDYEGSVALCKGNTTVQAPKPSEEELSLMREQLGILQQTQVETEMLKPFVLQTMGLVEENGAYRHMTEEEKLAMMTPNERLSQEALTLTQQRQIAALKGELPVSPALEADIASQEKTLREGLSRRLGADWETTTPGIQALSEFQKRSGLLREEARRGEIAGGTGLALSQRGYRTAEEEARRAGYIGFGQRLLPTFSAYGQAMQPYQYRRGMELQAQIATAQARAKEQASLYGGLGRLVGTGLMAYGTYKGLAAASSEKFKKDISKFSDKEALEMVKNTEPVTYRYKGERTGSPKHIGLIAEQAPDAITTPDKQMIDLGNQVGLVTAAVKALAKKTGRSEHRRRL